MALNRFDASCTAQTTEDWAMQWHARPCLTNMCYFHDGEHKYVTNVFVLIAFASKPQVIRCLER
jgi:hypothetical protein